MIRAQSLCVLGGVGHSLLVGFAYLQILIASSIGDTEFTIDNKHQKMNICFCYFLQSPNQKLRHSSTYNRKNLKTCQTGYPT